MDRIQILGIVSFVIACIGRAFKEDLPRLKTVSPQIRAIILGVLAIIGSGIDSAVQGSVNVPQALLAAAILGGPGLLMMVLEWFGGKSDDTSGSATIDQKDLKSINPPASPTGFKMLALALCFSIVGCTPQLAKDVTNVLDKIIVQILDGDQYLGIVKSAFDAYFAFHPNADNQAKAEKYIADAHTALDALLQADQGAKAVTTAELDKAKGDFLLAYQDITSLLKDLGVSDTAGKFAVVKGVRIAIPTPKLALPQS